MNFKEFEKLLINTINDSINNPNNNNNSGLLNIETSSNISDYIDIYKFLMKMKDKK